MSAPMEVRAPGLIYVQIPAYRDAELAPQADCHLLTLRQPRLGHE